MTEVVPSNVPEGSTQALFIDSWQVYRKMVDNDYLFHRGAYGELGRLVRSRCKAPYRFVDVACGDASMTVGALIGTPVSSYLGIDISETALDIARTNLARLGCDITLTSADFAAHLQDWAGQADVVWIGLSLHHFQNAGKCSVMSAIRRIVGDDGVLLVYENSSPDGEDRSRWMERWDAQKPGWTAYSDAEWEYVRNHVNSSDYPETDSGWRDLGRRAGFARVTEHYRTPTDLFRLYGFEA
jgi:ubiquinone/menaquinone biosynthesis C-methylase UbiE